MVGKRQLKPIGRKNGCSLVWRMQSKENAEEGSFSLVPEMCSGASPGLFVGFTSLSSVYFLPVQSHAVRQNKEAGW